MAAKFDPLFLERRDEPRHKSVLAIGKVTVCGRERFCLVRDVSSGGMMIEALDPPAPDTEVRIETLGLAQCAARVVWCKDQIAGLAFDEPQNLEAICRRGVDERGLIVRGPRFRTERVAQFRLSNREPPVEVVNISVGGARLRGVRGLEIDTPGQLIMGAPMPVLAGYVRWSVGDEFGFRFAPQLDRRALYTLLS